jgi:pimeloyl-ACP methyl ester carboxylesterase
MALLGPTLHAVERGTGPRLILVHGVAGSCMVWDEISPGLEPYFTLTSVDLLGYGHSPKPRTAYTPGLHVESIRRTLRRMEIDPPHTLSGSRWVRTWSSSSPVAGPTRCAS